MTKKDPRVDAYIEKSAAFAKPILNHIRGIVHNACPDVEEALKWGMPNFLYKGMMCNMAAFKEHCAFGFWKGKLVLGDRYAKAGEEAMGSFGRITKISDLPSEKVLGEYIKKAMKLNEDGVKAPAIRKTSEKVELNVPSAFTDAPKKNKSALETFESFSPGNKRDYVMWIAEAKTEETRANQVETAVKWMAEGKVRNWKYLKKKKAEK